MIKFPESVSTSTVDGELVLLNSDTGIYFGLNHTATRMVELLRDLKDADAAVDLLVNEFNAPAERIRSDMNTLLNSLKEKGLIIVNG